MNYFRALFVLPLVTAAFFSCKKTYVPSPEELAQQERAREEAAHAEAVARYVDSLTDAEKISQLFLVNIDGKNVYHPVERASALYGSEGKNNALVPGGCLLFSYNIAESAEKIAAFTASVRRFYAENGSVPPYIAIDQEGGDVNRLRKITSTLVSQKKTVEWFTPEQAQVLYAAQARQLKLLGIQMNLAPVIEVETPSNTAFLDTRTFGSLEAVLSFGDAAVRAFEDNGVAVVLKHFPGNSSTDPHTGLPHITYAEETRDLYFKPFEMLLPSASCVLMSHAVVQKETANAEDAAATSMPACFSRYWVTEVAREQFGFAGLIFSDDIFMGALANNGYPPEKAAVSALEAGVNCIMLSEKTFGRIACVLLDKTRSDEAFAALVEDSVRRVILFKIRVGLLRFEKVQDEASVEEGSAEASFAYNVVAAPDFESFDAAAFSSAYDEGMAFYK